MPSWSLFLCPLWPGLKNTCLDSIYESRRIVQSFHHHHHHHHVAPSSRISLTLSHYPSLSSIVPGRSSALHPVSVGFSWSSCLCSSILRGLQEYITYKFLHTSPAGFRMSGSSNLGSFHNGWSRCSSYIKGSLRVAFSYSRPTTRYIDR